MADGNMYTWLLQCKQSGFDMNYINKNSIQWICCSTIAFTIHKYCRVQLSYHCSTIAFTIHKYCREYNCHTIVIPLQYNCLYNTQILQRVQLSYHCSTIAVQLPLQYINIAKSTIVVPL